jgi:hypothetical protein
MKRQMKTVLFSLAILSFAACGGAEEKEGEGGPTKIDNGDVKGTIELNGADFTDQLNLSNGEGKWKAVKVEITDIAEFTLAPSSISFEEAKAEIEKKAESNMFGKTELISAEGDVIYYKETKKPFKSETDEEKEGYGFIRIVKKPGADFYRIESNGDTPLDPIWSKEDCDKLLKIANSFKAS